jgi:hypothetical protein
LTNRLKANPVSNRIWVDFCLPLRPNGFIIEPSSKPPQVYTTFALVGEKPLKLEPYFLDFSHFWENTHQARRVSCNLKMPTAAFIRYHHYTCGVKSPPVILTFVLRLPCAKFSIFP